MNNAVERFLGVDGCRGGWLGVVADERQQFVEAPRLWRMADAMIAALFEFELALIDVPIGLPEGTPCRRRCDIEARRLLQQRRSSVFLPPARATLRAHDYTSANAINFKRCGKKISMQMWNIVPRIRAIDRLLRRDLSLQQKLRESHPEVCFLKLNDGQPARHSKKTQAGERERIRLLARHSGNARRYYRDARGVFARRDIMPDDLLDAMALALHASLASTCGLASIPEKPEYDRTGLRMEMVTADHCVRAKLL